MERTVLHIVNSGYELCDTAVLCPDDEYMDLLMNMCDQYKVPVEFPEAFHADTVTLLHFSGQCSNGAKMTIDLTFSKM